MTMFLYRREASLEYVQPTPLHVLFPPQSPFPGTKSRHPLPERLRRDGGVLQRLSRLRPAKSEAERVTATEVVTPFVGSTDTSGKILFHPLPKNAKGL